MSKILDIRSYRTCENRVSIMAAGLTLVSSENWTILVVTRAGEADAKVSMKGIVGFK